ncbi:hypothetical protein SADUNF_Sadunf15G0038600 [Salix dunnii]|uniref:Uncharacterized protein n=1 Tax=Salix dunnii TaxID=1413687 RepID=A0A835JFI5_9ROSI|nr:hypothetical protein SADUNF_Sadunf15G0038600 [Salix dunnii]
MILLIIISSKDFNQNLPIWFLHKNHKTSPIQVNNVAAKRSKLPSSSLSFVVEEEKGGGGNIDESLRPWNLRTRRAACKVALRIEEDPTRRYVTDYPRREVEEYFLEIVRIRPARRPKKRPRILQKYLDSIFPGLWLAEITPDTYKAHELPAS